MNLFKIVIFQLFLLISFGLNAQKGTKVKFKPSKYERTELGVDLSISKEVSSRAWEVYINSEECQVFTDANLSSAITYELTMGQRFWVLDETNQAVHLIGSHSGYIPYENARFTNDAVNIGWVNKDQLLLWDSPVYKNGIACKIALKKDIYPFEKGDICSVFDTKSNKYLICNSLQISSESELLWVDGNFVLFLESRNCYAPKSNSEELILYSSSDDLRQGVNAEEKELDLNEELNDFFIVDQQGKEGIFHCSADGVHAKYVDEMALDKTIALDNTEKSELQEFIGFFTNSNNPKDFSEQIIPYLKQKNIEGGNLLDVLSLYIGVELSNEKAYSQDSVINMPQQTFISLQQKFRLLSKDLNKTWSNYVNGNGQGMYFVRENLFPATTLAAYIFSGDSKSGNSSSKEIVNSYDLFYFDCSDPSLSFDKKKEIEKKMSKLVYKLEKNEQSHLLFLSDGSNPIIGEGETKMNEIISLLFDKSSTYYPLFYADKQKMEKMIFSKIGAVTKEINLHFFLSSQIIFELNIKRPMLLMEFPERLAMLLGKSATKLNVDIFTASVEAKTELEKFISNGRFSQMNQIFYNVKLLK